MSNKIRELLIRAAQGEPIEALEAEAQADLDVEEAERALHERFKRHCEHNDDGYWDREIDAAARDLVDAQNTAFRARDPEWYNERKQMGTL